MDELDNLERDLRREAGSRWVGPRICSDALACAARVRYVRQATTEISTT
jgi:hypothetical protein